jgi:hypothetical protein
MGLKLPKARWIEAAILAPASVAMSSALPFGIVTCLIVLAAGLLIPGAAFKARLHDAVPVMALLLMMLAAAAGLGSLWLTILFGPDWVRERATRRITILLALTLGIAAVVYWFAQLDIPPHDAGSGKALLVWAALVLGPLVVAAKHVYILSIPRIN